MPIFLEPNQKYPVVLDADKGKTPTPTFYARSQSMRGQQRIAECLDRLQDESVTAAELFDETIAVLGQVLVGWSNMGRDFDAGTLGELLTYNEARELLRKVMYNQHLDSEEKKS